MQEGKMKPKQIELFEFPEIYSSEPCLILATVGSGKTYLLVQRLKWLKENGFEEMTTAISYTNEAVNEIKRRIRSRKMMIKTLHSIGYLIVRKHLGRRTLPLLDENEQLKIISKIIKKVDLELLSLINRIKESLIDDEQIFDLFPDVFPILKKYEEEKGDRFDFADLIVFAVDIMDNDKIVAEEIKQKTKYLHVDECQDLNKAQIELIERLYWHSLFLVGDLAQSIYSFRGARPDLISQFQSIHPEIKIIRHNTCFRCPIEIVKCANNLSNYFEEFERIEIQPLKKLKGEVKYLDHFPTPMLEAKAVLDLIDEEIKQNRSIAVLYRCNAQSRPFEELLARGGFNFYIRDSFFDRREIQDIINYLRVIYLNDIESLIQIINRPTRYLTKSFLEQLMFHRGTFGDDVLTILSQFYYGKDKQQTAYWRKYLDKLMIDIVNARKLKRLKDVVDYIYDEIGLQEWWKLRQDEPISSFDEFKEFANEFITGDELLQAIAEIKVIESDKEEKNLRDKFDIHLMTVHQAKGREWDVVFLVGLTEGILPSFRAENLDEERRICFVGLTRAKLKCYLSSHIRGKRFKKQSRFLYEMDVV